MLKIRRSCDRLIFNMGNPIPGKHGLYVETGPCPWRQFSRGLIVMEISTNTTVVMLAY